MILFEKNLTKPIAYIKPFGFGRFFGLNYLIIYVGLVFRRHGLFSEEQVRSWVHQLDPKRKQGRLPEDDKSTDAIHLNLIDIVVNY